MTNKQVSAEFFQERHFISKQQYQRPGMDVVLDVIFTNPQQQCITVPAFWAGGDKWVVRYHATITGTHRFITQCSDINNADLHQQVGEIQIQPYTGNNPLLQHGAPVVAKDNRHFCHEDQTPFFWLGDTWWMGLCQRLSWPDDFQQLAADRQQKGFNVIQLVAGLYPDMAAFDARGASESGFCWEKDFVQISPAFFDEADARILHLVSLGIVPCILGSWGYYLQWMGVEKMQVHWRYIMARWGALPVVWAAAGEQTMPWYLSSQKAQDSQWLKESWTAVINYMRSINAFKRLITTHSVKTARGSVTDPAIIDFDMQQTDHQAATTLQAAQAITGWESTPSMPVISGESRYEALEVNGKVSDSDARQAFWAHTINSGLAGHTYGANGIWQVNTKQMVFGQSPNGHNWGKLPWQEAMELAGAKQLSIAKEFLLSMPWHEMKPILTNKPTPAKSRSRLRKLLDKIQTFIQTYQTPVAAAETNDHHLRLYYCLSNKPFKIDCNPNCQSYWYDPRNGKTINAQPQAIKGGKAIFQPPQQKVPAHSDWLFIIQQS